MRWALALIVLHGIDGQVIYVNPSEIVSARAPQTEFLHSAINCSLQTVDGKLINVAETCEVVLEQIDKSD